MIKSQRENQVNTNVIPKILDDLNPPSWYSSGFMTDTEIARSIRFPKALWDAIDREAEANKRSAVKHLEYLLSVYFREEMADIKRNRLSEMRGDITDRSVPNKKQTVAVLKEKAK